MSGNLNLGLAIGNLVTYVFMIVMNVLSNLKFFNGATNGSVSAKYPTLFTPAGYAFSIWSLIFVALGAFSIFQILPNQRKDGGVVSRISFLLIVNFLCNGIWSVAFNYEIIWLTEVIMLGTLTTLIAIYIRLDIGAGLSLLRKGGLNPIKDDSVLTFWLAHVPFSLYLGWISVATIANTSILLWSLGVRSNQEIASICMQVVAAVLGLAMLIDRQDAVFALVITWALAAISVKQADFPNVHTAALVLAIIEGGAALIFVIYRTVSYFRSRRGPARL